jgi:predicted HTH transcriptional regulator
MKSILEKTEFTLSDIETLILDKAEESLNIEFKSGHALNTDDKSKNEITKDISAFANSDGGILIYGLKEDANNIASEIVYVDSKKYSLSWLQQIIDANIQRKIPDLKMFSIQNPHNPFELIYVI